MKTRVLVLFISLAIILFISYKLPTYLASTYISEEKLTSLVNQVVKTQGARFNKKIDYYIFLEKLDDEPYALNFNNLNECGEICLGLFQDGYVDQFYSHKDFPESGRRYFKQYYDEQGKVKETEITSQIYYDLFSRMECEFFEFKNYLYEYFSFKDKYVVCTYGGSFVEAHAYLDLTNSSFGGFPDDFSGKKSKVVARLSWYNLASQQRN